MIHLDFTDGTSAWLTSEQLAEKYPELHAYINQPKPYADQGKQLRDMRVEMNISLREMSKRLGIKASELCKFERGIIRPTEDMKRDYELIQEHGL